MSTVVNDAVATLLTGMYLYKDCRLAVIMGSGTNASLLYRHGEHQCFLINTEWAAYGEDTNDYLPMLEFDKLLDSFCESKRQYFEKMTSGLYLPQLYNLHHHNNENKISVKDAKELSELEMKGDEFAKFLSDRSVNLVAAAILGALEFISPDHENNRSETTTVVLDGSLYEKYYKYAERLQKRINEYNMGIKLVLGKDFSSIGSIIPLLK